MYLNIILLRSFGYWRLNLWFWYAWFPFMYFCKKKCTTTFIIYATMDLTLSPTTRMSEFLQAQTVCKKKYTIQISNFLSTQFLTLIVVYLFRKILQKKYFNTLFKIGTFFTKIIKVKKGGKFLFSCHYFQKLNDPGLESTFFDFFSSQLHACTIL